MARAGWRAGPPEAPRYDWLGLAAAPYIGPRPLARVADVGRRVRRLAATALRRLREGVYVLLEGQRLRYSFLGHYPFQVRVAVLNGSDGVVPVTVRLFLVPDALFDPAVRPTTEALRQGRRFAIELDKVKFEAPPGRSELVRASRDMSVIRRRPAVVDPAEVAGVVGGDQHESAQECTCG